MLDLDHRYDFDGHQIAWGRLGTGPALVLVHGFPWSAQIWRNIAPSLAERRTVYVYDMLGSGQSDKSKDLRPEIQDALLSTLLDAWGLDKPEIVGHDFGGLATLRAHFIRGRDYAKMTLFNAVGVLPSGSPFFSHVRKHEPAFRDLPAYAHDALLRVYMQASADKELRPDALEMFMAPWIGEIGQPSFYQSAAQSNLDAIEELQPRLQAPGFPVDIIWGCKDTFIPVSQGRELAARLGARSFKEVPDAAHLVQEDSPAALVGHLLNALD